MRIEPPPAPEAPAPDPGIAPAAGAMPAAVVAPAAGAGPAPDTGAGGGPAAGASRGIVPSPAFQEMRISPSTCSTLRSCGTGSGGIGSLMIGGRTTDPFSTSPRVTNTLRTP